jgi:hypothetical protein
MKRAPLVSLLSVIAVVAGCGKVLGVDDIAVQEPLNVGPQGDRSPSPPGTTGAVVKDAPEAPTALKPSANAPSCNEDLECFGKLPKTKDGKACATAKCVGNKCLFQALDDDNDGFTIVCESADPANPIVQSQKVDCNDKSPGIVPGSSDDCTGDLFQLPRRGECLLGKRTCLANGSFGACIGVKGPSTETCQGKDNNCNGIPDDGCPCSAGQARECGSSATGICRKGTQSCSANGQWGPCLNAVEARARDCTSAEDNDCDGQPDNQNGACLCDGKAPGTSEGCNTGASGICAAGTKQCNVSMGGAAWSACTGAAPRAIDCFSANDNNCDGKPDNTDVLCTCNGVAPGTTRACGATACGSGTQSCNLAANGASWSSCSGGGMNPQPKNCGSSADSDCNGIADNTEPDCLCPTSRPVGSTRSCGTRFCRGLQRCVSLGSTASWDTCDADPDFCEDPLR